MRFEQETAAGTYSITIAPADRNDPEDLHVVIGFRPKNLHHETARVSFYMMPVDGSYISYGLTCDGDPNQTILKTLGNEVAQCAYKFLKAHNIKTSAKMVWSVRAKSPRSQGAAAK